MPRRRREPAWARSGDEELLSMRLCDLDLAVEGTAIEDRVARLYDELDGREIRHNPHVWFSSEWFSPDGIPGIAVPFYLAHPRLMRLEKRMMLEVEGAGDRDCMRILRHEAGHAISTAYRLHRRKRWREIFGPVSRPYPQSYRAQPRSRDFVLHLPAWYAQAHPAEDFAETFAVWLLPRARWRALYRDWPAIRKLEYVDELMAEIAGSAAPVRSRRRIEPLRSLRGTLRNHYRRKQRKYGDGSADFYDRDLKLLFPEVERGAPSEAASRVVRRHQRRVREVTARWTGAHAYTIDLVLREMIERTRDLKLRHHGPDEEILDNLQVLVTVHAMKYIQVAHRHIAL